MSELTLESGSTGGESPKKKKFAQIFLDLIINFNRHICNILSNFAVDCNKK
jgi:hypothetical protein